MDVEYLTQHGVLLAATTALISTCAAPRVGSWLGFFRTPDFVRVKSASYFTTWHFLLVLSQAQHASECHQQRLLNCPHPHPHPSSTQNRPQTPLRSRAGVCSTGSAPETARAARCPLGGVPPAAHHRDVPPSVPLLRCTGRIQQQRRQRRHCARRHERREFHLQGPGACVEWDQLQRGQATAQCCCPPVRSHPHCCLGERQTQSFFQKYSTSHDCTSKFASFGCPGLDCEP